MNQQPIEKQEWDAEGALDIHSIFLTIQGEGPFIGQRAVFVRLAGCNLQCPGCDTDYTGCRKMYQPEELLNEIVSKSKGESMLVVFTGGEPFRQNLVPIIKMLQGRNDPYWIQIETNGTLSLPNLPTEITIVCSPKTGSIHKDIRHRIDALKYVVKAGDVDPEDGLPLHALEHSCGASGVAKPGTMFAHVYVQPMDEKDHDKNAANLRTAMDTVMKTGYTLGVQLHKIIGAE